MGTEIMNENGVFVKRFYGGKDRGVCFAVTIDRSFTQLEFSVLLGIIMKKLIVQGEGKGGMIENDK